MLKKFPRRRRARGQGLVEYAVTIALVGLVAVVALGLIGLAINRIYGVVGGTLGTSRNSSGAGATTLYFEPSQPAQCGIYTDPVTHLSHVNLYGEVWIVGLPKDALTVSTDQGFTLDINPHSGSSSLWNIQHDFGLTTDGVSDSACPHSLVVQSSTAYGGQTIFQPVIIKDW
ncbi:MAG TPA: hypothetical protein VKQ72_07580 [Aggregatilineales bacterium]|nr:hypothetical protein [Aggregatilineales bacterium]